MHAITSSATVTLVRPLPVVAGGAITGTVTAISTRSGDRSSFQEQPEIPTPDVGSLIADIQDGMAALNDLHEQLVAAGQSLIAATTATLAELTNALASATAQVATEQMDALEEMLALKVEESVRLTAALAGAERELNAAGVDLSGTSQRVAGLILVELLKLQDAKAARQWELTDGLAVASAEQAIAVQIAALASAAHANEATNLTAIRAAAAAQRPYAWKEAADNIASIAGSLALDLLQLMLSAAGSEQTVGGLANLLNATISYARGDYFDASLSLMAAAPGLGAGADAIGLGRAFARVSRTFGRFGHGVVNTASAVNRRLNCGDVNMAFRAIGKVLGRCFVGDTLVLIGEFEHGQTLAIVDAEISTELPAVTPQDASSDRWSLLWLAVGIAGVVILSDRKKNTVPALVRSKARKKLDPVDDPLPPPLTTEELDALCDELFGVSERHQSSRLVPRDEGRTSNDIRKRDEPLTVVGTSPCASTTLALAEKPIICTERQLTAPQPVKTKGRIRKLFAGVCFTFFTLLAAWNYFDTSSPPVTKNVAESPIIAANAAMPPALFQVAAEAKPRFASKPIRDIFPIADRVIAKNPEEQPNDENLLELDLTDLSETGLAELEAELFELIDNEPLPALVDGIDDETELVAFNDDGEEDAEVATADSEPTKAERLYEELLASAASLSSQPLAFSPELTDYGPFVRDHWRVIRFLLTRPDGDKVRIWLARPTWWLEAEQIRVGGQYEFDMEEVGAVGLANVLRIESCPEPPRRQNEDHHLVTGKFEHEATNVIDLYIEGEDDPIGTTANHPFWSEDRQSFVEAESLRAGENLLNAEGQLVRVITHSPRPGPQSVYNLEVDGEHVYSVTEKGVLVHNTYTNSGMRAFVNQLVNGWRRYMDPFTGTWRRTRQRLAADHMFPVNKMKELRGWNKLTQAQKREVMMARKNLTGLPSRLNSSKGDREARDLTKMLGKETSGTYRRWLGGQQANMRRHLQSLVNKMLGK